jgi:hypothetical protein
MLGCGGGGGGDDTQWPPLFEPKPECTGAPVAAYQGDTRNVISYLEIGDLEDGFDLDGERDADCDCVRYCVPVGADDTNCAPQTCATGAANDTCLAGCETAATDSRACTKPDNKLAAVGNLAQDAINSSFEEYSILIPFEFFDLGTPAVDTCVKFALYLGSYVVDADMDGDDTARPDGDCNDHDMAINRNAVEVVGDRIDNDCDGLADEDPTDNTPSNNNMDMDMDTFSLAEGDCDDTNAMINPMLAETCGDGYDNDCDGVADRGMDGTTIECNPFDLAASPEPLSIDPLSFDMTGAPVIAFTSGEIVAGGSTGLLLRAGPGLFSVAIPVQAGLVLDLRITGATIEAEVVSDANGVYLQNGRLGGVIDAQTADKIMGLDVKQIGLTPDKTLLDATFANLLGPLLALPRASDEVDAKYPNCRTPDIDVDGDGLEAFCDSTSEAMVPNQTVDVCIDGDGTEHRDMNGVNCTQAVDGEGRALFRDGISVEINFDTVPAGMFSPL